MHAWPGVCIHAGEYIICNQWRNTMQAQPHMHMLPNSEIDTGRCVPEIIILLYSYVGNSASPCSHNNNNYYIGGWEKYLYPQHYKSSITGNSIATTMIDYTLIGERLEMMIMPLKFLILHALD